MTVSSQTDVIIIGAGAAGLSAAKELTELGLSFILVEGSHRIGGRAYLSGIRAAQEIATTLRSGIA